MNKLKTKNNMELALFCAIIGAVAVCVAGALIIGIFRKINK